MGFVKDRVTKMPRIILRAVAPSFATMLLQFSHEIGLEALFAHFVWN